MGLLIRQIRRLYNIGHKREEALPVPGTPLAFDKASRVATTAAAANADVAATAPPAELRVSAEASLRVSFHIPGHLGVLRMAAAASASSAGKAAAAGSSSAGGGGGAAGGAQGTGIKPESYREIPRVMRQRGEASENDVPFEVPNENG